MLKISRTTVIETLKKDRHLKAINEARSAELELTQTIVKLCHWEDLEAEADEMWSDVGSKKQQRWLWHAIDHQTGEVLAYVLSHHQDSAFLALKALLEPFGIMQFYTDAWGAYVGVACRRYHVILIQRFTSLARQILKGLSASI
nr:IS1 family transposase [Leptolyngbya sp. Cla-17]